MRWSGYEHATRILYDHIATHPATNDLQFPLLWLARHAVELGLKECVSRGLEHGLGGADDQVLWSTHNLEVLAQACESFVNAALERRYLNDQDVARWQDLKAFLMEWQCADPDGIFLRYARRKVRSPLTKKAIFGVPYDPPMTPEGYTPNFYAKTVADRCLEVLEFLRNLSYGLDAMDESLEQARMEHDSNWE